MPSKPRRQLGFGRRCRDLQQQQRGPKLGGGKKVAKSSGVVGGGCVCRKVALGSRCSRCGPTGLAGAFAHRAGAVVDRAAGCERWMPTGCNKYAPQKTAGLPGTELRKREDRQH